ncbi:MAG: GNAT family N-acetyltransferase [Brachybacterium sp.]|nr:GNAT family N-acetyltransferase [Brachybacterium sp.]MDN5900892.1 GNAT family N-acetyltransferase [Brachybacterium sp.]
MTIDVAREIADSWSYPAPYDFYDMTADPEDYDEFVTPQLWPEVFLQVRRGEELFGFLSGNPSAAAGGVEIALGMCPDLTGKGLGRAFMEANVEWLLQNCPGQRIHLNVAAFNVRALRTYEGVGFRRVRTFEQATNGSIFDFVEMEYADRGPAGSRHL